MKYYKVIKLNGKPPEKIMLIREPDNLVDSTFKQNIDAKVEKEEIGLDEFQALLAIMDKRTGAKNINTILCPKDGEEIQIRKLSDIME